MVGKGGAKTTSGHGIFSQYRPEHMKQWILGENKHRDMQAQKSLKELRELTKCSDEVATGGSGSPTKRDGTESYKRIPDFHDFLATTSGPIDVSNKRDDLWGESTWDGSTSQGGAGASVTAEGKGLDAADKEGTAALGSGKAFLSLPPHLVHHHHFGWQHSQNNQERIVGTLSNRESYRKYGDAMSYCQLINTKHSLISTRKS